MQFSFTKEFWQAALIRSVRTIAQSAVAIIGASALISEVNWLEVISGAIMAGLLSILNAIATGLPEVNDTEAYTPKH